jgi:excisionase family DNA binding protein
MTDDQPVMNVKEVAAYLHCHTSTVYRLVKAGGIPAFRLRNARCCDWRFLRAEIDKWMRDETARMGRGAAD